jgi:hypothetical protein
MKKKRKNKKRGQFKKKKKKKGSKEEGTVNTTLYIHFFWSNINSTKVKVSN